jgi:hypothetical protein
MAPGFMVQPPAGKPLKATLPVWTVQVGWVMVPMTGAAGAPGAASTVNAVAVEVQPLTVVVTSYSPAASPEKIPVVLF